MKIGVLDLQGSVIEHINILNKCGAIAVAVKYPQELDGLAGLIIPGGESTVIGRLMRRYNFTDKIKQLAVKGGLAVYGTCAGMVLLSAHINSEEVNDYKLGLIDIEVKRNAFGRQQESFEADINIKEIADKPYPAVFIRAPIINKTSEGVEILAEYEGKIIAARQNNILVSSFHPELTDDVRFHKYFITMCQTRNHREHRVNAERTQRILTRRCASK